MWEIAAKSGQPSPSKSAATIGVSRNPEPAAALRFFFAGVLASVVIVANDARRTLDRVFHQVAGIVWVASGVQFDVPHVIVWLRIR